jgi:hypothetical protein
MYVRIFFRNAGPEQDTFRPDTKNVFILRVRILQSEKIQERTMGIFDAINKVRRKVETEVNNADKARSPAPQQKAPAAAPARTPHPGYSRITAWMKTRYKGKIAGVSDPYQKNLELEQIAAEATSGLSVKAKKGFLDYLKSQNYEQLLK